MTSYSNRFMQFSVREVLLAIVAIAAILALIVSHLPYSPSAFITNLNEEAILEKVCSDLKIPLVSEGNGGGHSRDTDSIQRESLLTFTDPDVIEFYSSIMPALHDHIEKLLLDQGASIHERSLVGRLKSFGFGYQLGNSHGEIRVYCFGQGEKVELLMFAEER